MAAKASLRNIRAKCGIGYYLLIKCKCAPVGQTSVYAKQLSVVQQQKSILISDKL
ncbi:MAG TPA: hypothetical protein ACHBX0_03635 [Arsenophonus sp.]